MRQIIAGVTVQGCSDLFVTQFPQPVPFYTSFYGQCDASLGKENIKNNLLRLNCFFQGTILSFSFYKNPILICFLYHH